MIGGDFASQARSGSAEKPRVDREDLSPALIKKQCGLLQIQSQYKTYAAIIFGNANFG